MSALNDAIQKSLSSQEDTDVTTYATDSNGTTEAVQEELPLDYVPTDEDRGQSITMDELHDLPVPPQITVGVLTHLLRKAYGNGVIFGFTQFDPIFSTDIDLELGFQGFLLNEIGSNVRG